MLCRALTWDGNSSKHLSSLISACIPDHLLRGQNRFADDSMGFGALTRVDMARGSGPREPGMHLLQWVHNDESALQRVEWFVCRTDQEASARYRSVNNGAGQVASGWGSFGKDITCSSGRRTAASTSVLIRASKEVTLVTPVFRAHPSLFSPAPKLSIYAFISGAATSSSNLATVPPSTDRAHCGSADCHATTTPSDDHGSSTASQVSEPLPWVESQTGTAVNDPGVSSPALRSNQGAAKGSWIAGSTLAPVGGSSIISCRPESQIFPSPVLAVRLRADLSTTLRQALVLCWPQLPPAFTSPTRLPRPVTIFALLQPYSPARLLSWPHSRPGSVRCAAIPIIASSRSPTPFSSFTAHLHLPLAVSVAVSCLPFAGIAVPRGEEQTFVTVDNMAATAPTRKPTLPPLQTPKTASFPSEILASGHSASPMPYLSALIKQEDGLKTPITPPVAYTEFLKALTPVLTSPAPTSAAPKFFSDESSGRNTPTSVPSSSTSFSSTRSGSHKSPSVSIPPPSPYSRPQSSTRSPSGLHRLKIPASPAFSPVTASSSRSGLMSARSPFSPADWGLDGSGKRYFFEAPRTGCSRPVSVRSVVTRTVTYKRSPPLEPAPKGKKRKLEHSDMPPPSSPTATPPTPTAVV